MRQNRKNKSLGMRSSRSRPRQFESLESRHALAADIFVTHTVAASETPRASGVHLADLDGDSDLDAISGSAGNGEVAWYENLNDSERFGPKRTIYQVSDTVPSTSLAPLFAFATADLDGDGDVDLIGSAQKSRAAETFWLENLDGRGTFGNARILNDKQSLSFVAVDFDGDQDLDLFVAAGWHENLDGKGNFSPLRVYRQGGDGLSVDVADFDADGDLDVTTGETGSLSWYRNLDGKGKWSERLIISGGLGVFNSAARDFDADGDLDILSANAFHSLAWFENTDGKGTFSVRHINEHGAIRLSPGDIDNDGDQDFAWDFGWYENLDGKGNFEPRQTIDLRFGLDLTLGDVDGDGDPDLLSAEPRTNRVQWFRNADVPAQFIAAQSLNVADVLSPVEVATADLDGDGDEDLVTVISDYSGAVIWYENLDGRGEFEMRQTVSVPQARYIFPQDLDGDDDVDLAFGSRSASLGWLENRDGRGTFGTQVRTIFDDYRTGRFADLDADGDVDLVATQNENGPIFVYANDGQGNFRSSRQVPRPDQREDIGQLSLADIDGDGDQDLVVGARTIGQAITWHANLDRNGTFGGANPISTTSSRPTVLRTTDLDGDGDQDVVYSDGSTEQILWHENLDGRGKFAVASPVAEVGRFVLSMVIADIDHDGDEDLALGEYLNTVTWYEHLDGAGTFGPRQVVNDNARLIETVFAADLNGDGQMEIISASSGDARLLWYERRLVGDVNRDDLFDSADLVAIFQAGEYEDAARDNSTFDDGDWNGDGEFDSADLLLAFQLGHFVSA